MPRKSNPITVNEIKYLPPSTSHGGTVKAWKVDRRWVHIEYLDGPDRGLKSAMISHKQWHELSPLKPWITEMILTCNELMALLHVYKAQPQFGDHTIAARDDLIELEKRRLIKFRTKSGHTHYVPTENGLFRIQIALMRPL